MSGDSGLAELLDRHRRFWSRGPDSVLVNQVPRRGFQPRPYPLADGTVATDPVRITAKDVDLQRLVGPVANLENGSVMIGELLGYVGPVFPEAWMESIIGCSIFASGFGCTAKPIPADAFSELLDMSDQALRGYLCSPWYGKLEEMLGVAATVAEEMNFPVRQPHLRGVVDMVAAFMGEERLCLETFDHPDELTKIADRFADIWISVVRAAQKLRKPWREGYVSSWKLYAPELLIDYQIDATSILSPEIYRDIFLLPDRRIFASFPYSIVHLHSVGLHMLDCVLDTEVKAIQINLDREAVTWDKELLINCCRKVQQAGKAVLVVGELSKIELRALLAALEHRGLAIDCWQKSVLL